MSLNPWQAAVARVYGDGDFAYIADEDCDEDYEHVGDSLFSFLMRELDEDSGCDSLETAIERMNTVINDVSGAFQALAELK